MPRIDISSWSTEDTTQMLKQCLTKLPSNGIVECLQGMDDSKLKAVARTLEHAGAGAGGGQQRT